MKFYSKIGVKDVENSKTLELYGIFKDYFLHYVYLKLMEKNTTTSDKEMLFLWKAFVLGNLHASF